MTPASIVAHGFLPGMRHASDADQFATFARRGPAPSRCARHGGPATRIKLVLCGGAVPVLGGVVPARSASRPC
jgi:hypothetical protein